MAFSSMRPTMSGPDSTEVYGFIARVGTIEVVYSFKHDRDGWSCWSRATHQRIEFLVTRDLKECQTLANICALELH